MDKGTTPSKARKRLKLPSNYAKHAREDHNLAYEYNQYGTELYIYCGLLALARLTTFTPSGLEALFCFRFKILRPRLYEDHRFKSFQFSVERYDVDALKRLSRNAFFQKFGGDFVGNPPTWNR